MAASRRPRRARSTHACDDTFSDAAHAGRLREHATAVTARSSHPWPAQAGRTRHRRHTLAALWRRCGLRQCGERHAVSRRRPGREGRGTGSMSASESQVKSVRACTAAVRSLSAHLARVALGRAARTPMPMMGAAATRPGRRAVEPMSFAALSSTAMAPERRAGRCERAPARPRWALGSSCRGCRAPSNTPRK